MNNNLAPYVRCVDDDEALLRSIEYFLNSSRIGCRCYTSGKDLLRLDPLFIGGCIVLDLKMPDMSGLQVFEELRKRRVDLPVLFFTAYGEIDTVVETMRDGAFHFVEKPLQPDKFLDIVKMALKESERRRTGRPQACDLELLIASLTDRELEIIRFVMQGMKNKNIAERMGLSERTVENYRSRAYLKLNVNNFAELSDLLGNTDLTR